MSKILGLSAFYHDSAAALIIDGRISFAAQEERFSRKKHDQNFPENAIKFCLDESGLSLSDLDYVAFYDKPFLKFERLIETYISFAPKGFSSFKVAMPIWIKEKLFQKDLLRKKLKSIDPDFDAVNKLLFSEHHLSHAASAFYPSPFNDALTLTMDGVGEWATTSAAIGSGNKLDIIKEIHFPNSLGLLYSAFTYYTGFRVNSGEYKIMGLAPYGSPVYTNKIFENLIDVKNDGSFRLNQEYFAYCTGLRMTNDKFASLFGGVERHPDEELTQHHMDLAASIQHVTEEIVLRLARSLAKETKKKNLCLAGGVALNCVANGKILREAIFDNIWVQPAAGDAGGALGAALTVHYGYQKALRVKHKTAQLKDEMKGSFLGPKFDQKDVERRLNKVGAKFRALAEDEAIACVAQALATGLAVGWFQGRMEFGPRALGGRSILADPRSPIMQKTLNLKVKFRESFRPFAPSVLRNEVSKWFIHNSDSPYMLMVAPLCEDRRISLTNEEEGLFGIEKLNVPRSEVPAITHVDYSARIQTVHRETNPKYYSLIEKFKDKTGCPMLVNTSFNVRGEPIVCSPEDAFRCFMGTELDMLVVENCILLKEDQPVELKQDYKQEFELD